VHDYKVTPNLSDDVHLGKHINFLINMHVVGNRDTRVSLHAAIKFLIICKHTSNMFSNICILSVHLSEEGITATFFTKVCLYKLM
jgi:hypothetical protein